MVRNYIKKTERNKTDGAIMQRAVDSVRGGSSIRKIAADYQINRTTLSRYLKKTDASPANDIQYKPAYNSRQVDIIDEVDQIGIDNRV